jgi:hypothetical protein
VLVSIGAEWGGWCRAFDARMKSAKRRYDPVKKEKRGDISQGAPVLARFTAENFVVVHIEDDFAPGAEDVVAAAGAEASFQEKYPASFAAKMEHPFVKIEIPGSWL